MYSTGTVSFCQTAAVNLKI